MAVGFPTPDVRRNVRENWSSSISWVVGAVAFAALGFSFEGFPDWIGVAGALACLAMAYMLRPAPPEEARR